MNLHLLEQQLLARCTFPETNEVNCAVSGGADSLALMFLALSAGRQVTVFHVDHGIREGSSKEARFVEDVAKTFGAQCELLEVNVENGPNLEARARKARYDVLPRDVLTGHTADDQAETVLLNLMRGSGISGLAGMRSVNKPLLKLRRTETEAVCKARGIEPFMDPSNSDPSIRRNRVRNELIPLLNDIAQRDVAEVIARQTSLIRDDDDLLIKQAKDIDASSAIELANADPSLARRAIRSWLHEHLDFEKHPPSSASIERILQVARGEATACEVEGGIMVRRSRQQLTAQPKAD